MPRNFECTMYQCTFVGWVVISLSALGFSPRTSAGRVPCWVSDLLLNLFAGYMNLLFICSIAISVVEGPCCVWYAG